MVDGRGLRQTTRRSQRAVCEESGGGQSVRRHDREREVKRDAGMAGAGWMDE